MGGQQFFIDSGLIIIALELRGCAEFGKVFVTRFIFSQEDEMVVNVSATCAGLLFKPAPRSDIYLATNNGLDAFVPRGLEEIDRAIQDSMVSNRQRGEF